MRSLQAFSLCVAKWQVERIAAIALAVLYCGNSFGADAKPDGDAEIVSVTLEKFKAATSLPKYLAFEARINEVISGDTRVADGLVLRQTWIKCRKSDQNWHVWRTEHGKFDREGTLSDYSLQIEVVIKDGVLISVQVENSGLMVKAYQDAANDRVEPTMYLNVGGLVFGDVMYDRPPPLLATARQSRVTIADTSKVNGDSKALIEMSGPNGVYKLTLDPRTNYLPSRLEIVKTASNKLLDSTVGETLGGDTLFFPDGALKQWSLIIDDVDVEMVDDRPFITGFEQVITSHFPGGRKVQVLTSYSCDRISTSAADADDSFSLTTEIPAKTRVYVKDSPGIKYVWEDGTFVVATTSADISGGAFSESPRKKWYLVANVLVIAAILIAIIFRSRNASAV